MIGGSDIVLRGAGAAGEGSFIVSWLRERWGDLVVQEASTESAVGAGDDSIPYMRELFVYRSRDDYESWMRDGASEENADTMIHVVLGTESTTLVTATVGSGAETAALGFALRDAILSRRVFATLRAQNVVHQPLTGSARRFRELLNDLILELPDADQRMDAIAACWATMTEEERADAERVLLHEAPKQSAGLALEDVEVNLGQRVAPTTRRAA